MNVSGRMSCRLPSWRLVLGAMAGFVLPIALAQATMAEPAPAFSPGPPRAAGTTSMPVSNGDPMDCEAPPGWEDESPQPLRRLAARLARVRPDVAIVVVGDGRARSASGRDGPTWPERLRERLVHQLAIVDGAAVRVLQVQPERGSLVQTAERLVEAARLHQAALVVWQITRSDARRHSPRELGEELARAMTLLGEAGVDVILATLPFHPRAEALFDSSDYRQQLRWVAGEDGIDVFPRYEWMQHWEQTGLTHLEDESPDSRRRDRGFIERCVADGVARLVARGVGAAGPGRR